MCLDRHDDEPSFPRTDANCGVSRTPRGKRRAASRKRSARAVPPAQAARERGTVLLMVLGVLALMAIIMVVYASLGKGDRATGAAATRMQRIDDQVDSFAAYLADVIRRDVFATYVQEDDRDPNLTNGAPIAPKNEAFDYPSTDVMTLSQKDPTPIAWETRQRDGFHAFNPEGSFNKAWRDLNQPGGGQRANRRDPRSPSDPFLAATEPQFVNRYSPDWTWRAFGYGATSASRWPWNGPAEDYLNVRDWGHISNFAPSGNFVNLWALRNNFRAEPGFQQDINDRPRLSSLLSTIDPATGYSYPINVAQRRILDPNANIFGALRTGDLRSNARLNRPADWTHWQVGAFRTTAELRVGNAANNAPFGVDDPEWMPYQWADADGDGMYDSRWFELVDIFDPNNPRSIVPNTGRARLFLAARAVDLSALVNINTASDFSFAPSRSFAVSRPNVGGDRADPLRPLDRPLPFRRNNGEWRNTGESPRNQTPPDIETENTSSLQDPGDWIDYRRSIETSVRIPAGLTPSDIDLQRLLRLSDSYYEYDVATRGASYLDLPQPPQNGPDALAGDYRAYDPQNNFRNLVIGDAAYQAIWEARQAAIAAGRRYTTPDQDDLITNERFIDTLKTADRRFAYYDGLGRRREPSRLRDTGVLNRYAPAFDQSDELELRTFQGLNDPDRTSRLEATAAGRFQDDPAVYSLSPLRDNRSSALERAGRDLAPPDFNTGTIGANDPYRKALLAHQLDVRRLITTINGARPIIDPPLVVTKVDEAGNVVDTTIAQFSEANGTLRTDGARLVSRMVETGNYSFNPMPDQSNPPAAPRSSDPCDFIDIGPTSPVMLANLARENRFDDTGWFELRPATRDWPWYYQSLDNRPPLCPCVANCASTPVAGDCPPTGLIEQVTAAGGVHRENYVASRLDLMREAFRAYADCLMPYTQWGNDPRLDSRADGPFPAAWDRDPRDNALFLNPTLAYGGDPELAYRLAAHMAVNLRDAVDSDRLITLRNDPLTPARKTFEFRDANQQTPVSLDLTQRAMIAYTNNPQPTGVDPLNNPNFSADTRSWQNYQRDREYPWPKLNLDDRFTSEDDRVARARMPRLPQQVDSTAHAPTTVDKRINIFGIEPQPFFTQVSAFMVAVDVPQSSVTPVGASGNPDDETCPPIDPTNPDPGPCEITINIKRCVDDQSPDCQDDNVDFICYVLAFQVTNPFESDVVLEPEDPTSNDNWYYIEYANRFYRLTPVDYREPVYGFKRNVPESQRILKPGETRVFYATYPHSMRDISDRIRRARQALAEAGHGTIPTNVEPDDEDGDPSGRETSFTSLIKHEFGRNAVHVAPMYPETGRAIGAFQTGTDRNSTPVTHRLGNPRTTPHRPIDLFAIAPDSSGGGGGGLGADLLDGPNGENRLDPATSTRMLDDIEPIDNQGSSNWTALDYDRMRFDPRRRVMLWRVLRDPDPIDGGLGDLDTRLQSASIRGNWIGNDLLLDRLYDPSPLPYVPGTRPAPSPALTQAEEDEIQRSANGSLVQALIKPFQRRLDKLTSAQNSSNIAIPGTSARQSAGSPDGPDQTGFTLVSWVTITRPLNPPRERDPNSATDVLGIDPPGRSPTGAMPPWCMEAKPDNVYTPGFASRVPRQVDSDPARRHWSLNRVKRYFGIHSDIDYKNGTEQYFTPLYRTLSDFIEKHTDAPAAPGPEDSSYAAYPTDYGSDNKKSTIPKFIDPELSVQYADRRGAKTILPFRDPLNPQNQPPNSMTRALEDDFRASYSIVDIDAARSVPGAETDEFYNVDAATAIQSNLKPRRFDQVAVEIHRLPSDMTDSAEPQLAPSRALFSRVGDFLLPLAIGPEFDPSAGAEIDTEQRFANSSGGNRELPRRRIARLDAQWTTLSEALATASDYYSGPDARKLLSLDSNQQVNVRNIYYRFARDTRGRLLPDQDALAPNLRDNVLVPKGDRGHLVLDAWTPYLDYNPGDGVNQVPYRWAALNPNDANSLREQRDAPLGNGIPMALNILDRFRVAGLPGETAAKPSDPRRCIRSSGSPLQPLPTVGQNFARVGRSNAYGSDSSIEPGRININTAPREVLRLLPLVSPSVDVLDTTLNNVLDGWCFDGRYTNPNDPKPLITAADLPKVMTDPFQGEPLNPPVPGTPAKYLWDPTQQGDNKQPWDIATTIEAYRDRIAGSTRRLNANAVPTEVNYRDDRRDNAMLNSDPVRSGRDDAFQINTEAVDQGGLRDAGGFKSVGEIMTLVLNRTTDQSVERRADNQGRTARNRIDSENSITRLASDGVSTRSLAIDSSAYGIDRTRKIFGSPEANGATNRFSADDVYPNLPLSAVDDNLFDDSGRQVESEGIAEGSDQIPDDYDEKLSIANAVLNSVTVRSDVFCVWFVINGFTPEDVLVDDGAAMVPSVAKRYVMVVDRSTVTSPTGKPRIVMLREVPTP